MFGILSTSEENDLSEFQTDAHEAEWKKLTVREQQIFLCGVRSVLQQIKAAKEVQ